MITTMRDGQTQQGSVLGVIGTQVQVRSASGATTVLPLANVAQVTTPAPAEYLAAFSAYDRGDLKGACAQMTTVVERFRGLPAPWAGNAMLTLGAMDVAAGKLAEAAAAFDDYQRAYPAANPEDATVGMALIDVARKDYDAANVKIGPALAEALKDRTPTPEAGALYGRAFYVSGQIKEQAGQFNGALMDYLRTVVIFPQDPLATTSSRERADALRRDQEAVVP
jgi:tetratricopeptide (TPR) repeat protein